MTTAGSRYGMSLQWVLALSCLFSWVRMEAYGRFAIMIVATVTLFGRGLVVERVLDMVNVLEPFAGRYAAALFLVGALSAGLSSVFPILLVAPLLASDYQGKGFDVKSPLARTLALIGCLFGLIVPILGDKELYIIKLILSTTNTHIFFCKSR